MNVYKAILLKQDGERKVNINKQKKKNKRRGERTACQILFSKLFGFYFFKASKMCLC